MPPPRQRDFREGIDTRQSEAYQAALAVRALPQRTWVEDGPPLCTEGEVCVCGKRLRHANGACRKCGRTGER